ncbi:MAG: toll/interleukin-1 receptor domain-containing protein [Deltaproteobacteria bacterium]|nr:toll/interleukin-1 receptor domain-containing protein [Deltaproteobacteria bacterium]
MTKRNVFISYRRDDAAGFSHAIYDRLVEHLPKEQVFMDVVGIEPGADFVTKLETTVDRCDVLLALIGKRWGGEERNGKPRIQDPQDWVHVEVGTALQRGVKVIPVLLDGASLPPVESLPVDLRPLVRMNAADVRTSRLNADVWDLTGATVTALGGKWPPDEPGGKIYAILTGGYAFFAGAVVLFAMLASMFMSSVPTTTVLATLIFVVNTLVLLRLPIHAWVRTLTRQQALRIGAVIHLIGFAVMAANDNSVDGAIVFVFGIVPTAALYLASFAMRRLVRS